MINNRKRIETCAAIALLAPTLAQARTPRPIGDFHDPVVAVGRCAFVANRAPTPTPSGPAIVDKAILPIIAATLITSLVNKVGDALSKMGDAKTWPTQASRNFEFEAGGLPQCLQLVRGSFYSSPHVMEAQWSGDLENMRTTLETNGTFLADTPDFFLEAEILKSSDSSAITVRPIISYMGRPAGTRALRSGDERIVALFLSITKPGESATLATAPGATLKLGKHSPGTWKRFPLPASGATFSSPYDAAWFNLPASYTAKPMTMNVLQTETQGESAFLKFIGGVLSDQKVKDETAKQLQQQLIPSVGAQADLAAEAARFTLRSTAESARLVAWGKLNACEADPSKADEAKDALRKFVSADNALPAGDEAKNGSVTSQVIESIKIGQPAKSVAQQCADLRDNYIQVPG
jgi:hypothetical protein